MKTRSLILAGALALATFPVASARVKTYDIQLDSPTKAGSNILAPGEYRVKVEGSNAVFTSVHTEKTFTAPVKIENANKKHDTTAVESNAQDGTLRLKAIELGGSTETLNFGD